MNLTPKRLGISHSYKRKSNLTPEVTKVSAEQSKRNKTLNDSINNDNTSSEMFQNNLINSCAQESSCKESLKDITDINLKIIHISSLLKKKEDIIKSIQLSEVYKKKHSIHELQSLVNLWKNGFKESLTHLHLLLEKKGENLKLEQLIMKLGVQEVVNKHFSNDSDLMGDELE